MLRRRMMGSKSELILTRKFISSTNWVVPARCKKVDVFLVGGGGSGSYSGGGGGYTKTFLGIPVVPGESIPIVVGSGGIGWDGIGGRMDGYYSQFKDQTYRADGGKCPPAFSNASTCKGGDGGSGGGTYTQFSSVVPHGGSNGQNGITNNGYYGIGQGSTTREFGDPSGKLYGGGGGGGAGGGSTPGRGADGAGNGATAPNGSNSYGYPAQTNTGGGGGGGTHGGANGGSGIVIVRGYNH